MYPELTIWKGLTSKPTKQSYVTIAILGRSAWVGKFPRGAEVGAEIWGSWKLARPTGRPKVSGRGITGPETREELT